MVSGPQTAFCITKTKEDFLFHRWMSDSQKQATGAGTTTEELKYIKIKSDRHQQVPNPTDNDIVKAVNWLQ